MEITYQGPPHFASLVAQTLEEGGLSATYRRPREERRLAQVVQDVVVHMSVEAQAHSGELDIESIHRYLARVTSRFPSIRVSRRSEDAKLGQR